MNPDLAKMRDYKVTLQQLFDALQRGNANAGGSYVEQGRQQFLIRGIGLLRSAETRSATSWSPSATACRCWCKTSPTSPSARCRARASSARTTTTTSSPASC